MTARRPRTNVRIWRFCAPVGHPFVAPDREIRFRGKPSFLAGAQGPLSGLAKAPALFETLVRCSRDAVTIYPP